MTVRRPENTDDAIRAAFLVRAFVVRFCGYGSVALCVCVCGTAHCVRAQKNVLRGRCGKEMCCTGG